MDINQILHNNWDNNKFIAISLNHEIKNEIILQTSFLDQYYTKIPLRIRAYTIKNNITEETIPKCKCGCQKPCALDITNASNGFRSYAGPSCSRKDKTVNKQVLSKLQDHDWLYDQRIIQQKSIEKIAEELQISHVPVQKWIRTHKIDIFDARSRNSTANKILRNKEELEKLYESGLTCEQIAEKLATTKSTVSRWLAIHEIKTREPNSYERKTPRISNEEQELVDYIRTVYDGTIKTSDRSILGSRELDVYMPDLALAIEYNGLYTHCYRPWESNAALIKGPEYHLNKTVDCSNKGIQLIHIFSDEWGYKKDIIKSMIRNKLKLNERVYGRKCKIVEVGTHEKNIFLNENHVQGEDKSKIKLGLVYEDRLISVMTFGRSRFNKSYDWELSRFCSLLGYNVVGGFSKLLGYFMSKWEGSIISYADRRYSVGGVYEKNGFELLHVNKPNYYYVDKNFMRRYNRMRFYKDKIAAHDCTEYERARDLGFNRIYDCGTLAYGLV